MVVSLSRFTSRAAIAAAVVGTLGLVLPAIAFPPMAIAAQSTPTPNAPDGIVGAGLPIDGSALPPTGKVAATIRRQAAAPAPQTSRPQSIPGLTFRFTTSGYTPHAIPTAAETPGYVLTSPLPLLDTGDHDAQGVRMFLVGTTEYNHPVAQAEYGLGNLASYSLTNDSTYLNRALAQAQRLVDTKVVSRGAWFYPYEFDFALHGITADTMRAPWYSAMAQGMALSLFVRLYEVTADPQWLDAADNTALSFSLPPAAGLPWVVHTDSAGYLWLDEYPLSLIRTDLTFNGHNFAIFGLYDYAQATGDAIATELFDGAATTSLKYGTNGFRVPGWVSNYCLTHLTPAGHYHDIHIEQLISLYSMTDDRRFAQLSDAYRSDFPHNTSSTVRFSKGSHTGYIFSTSGAITGSKVLKLSAASAAPASKYFKIKGRGLYLLISAGSLSGYWVPETPNVATAVGPIDTGVYSPQRVALFHGGLTTAYRFNSSGLPSSSVQIMINGTSSAPFDESSTYNGARYVRITAGNLANYWIATSQLSLA
jgi:hypothetical protein